MVIVLLVLILFALLFRGLLRALVVLTLLAGGAVLSFSNSGKANDFDDARRIHDEVVAYARAHQISVNDLAARIRISPHNLELFVYASEKEGLTAEAALNSLQDDELPRYDPETACKHMSMLSDSSNRPASFHVCIEREQEAYERLKYEWPLSTHEERRESLKAMGGPERTYDFLAAHLGAIVRHNELVRQRDERQKPNHFNFD